MVTAYNAKKSLDCNDEKYDCGINIHWLVSSSRNLYYRKSSFPLEIFAVILAFGMISVRSLPFLGTDTACLRSHLSHSSHILFLKDISVAYLFVVSLKLNEVAYEVLLAFLLFVYFIHEK